MLKELFLFFCWIFFTFTEYIWEQTGFFSEYLVKNIHFFEGVGEDGRFQVVKLISFVVTFSCAIPVLLFAIFGFTSIVITLGGFLFIEGALLTFGVLCMVACMSALVLVLSILVVIPGVFYIVALKLGCVLKNFEPTSNIPRAISTSIDK